MSKAKKDDDEIVSASDLARRLGLTVSSVSRLAGDGVLVRGPGRGEYRLWPSVAGYVEHLRRSSRSRASPASTARAKLLNIQSERQAHQLAVEKGGFVPFAEGLAVSAAMSGLFKSGLLALRSRLADRLSLSREGAAVVYDEACAVLKEVSEANTYSERLVAVANAAVEAELIRQPEVWGHDKGVVTS